MSSLKEFKQRQMEKDPEFAMEMATLDEKRAASGSRKGNPTIVPLPMKSQNRKRKAKTELRDDKH